MPKVNPARLIVAAILAIFMYGVVAAMFGTIMPSWKLSPEQSANIAFAQAIGLIIASLSAGPIVDNTGKELLPAGQKLEQSDLDQFPPGAPGAECSVCMYWWNEGISVELPPLS